MTTQRKQRLVIIALVITFAWPLINIFGALLFAVTSTPGQTLTIGGRVEPDDDLLPAGDPALAPFLHSKYHIYVNQKNAGGAEIELSFGASPPVLATALTLRGVACRVGGWLARQPGWPQPSALTLVPEQSQDSAPVEIKVANCPAAPA